MRAWGSDRVILALTESHVPLNNQSLRAVLKARAKRELADQYVADLVYLAAKAQYSRFEGQKPSELIESLYSRQSHETDGNKIKERLVEKLKRRQKK